MRLPAAWRPMVPWAVAAVLCVPLALSLLTFSLLMDPDNVLPADLERYAALLDRGFSPPPEGADLRRGIVFATSGLACATAGPERLPGEPVELMVLTKTSASLLHFKLLADPAIAARPDFFIVQSTLLVDTNWNTSPNAADAARFFWRHQVLASMPGLAGLGPPGRATPSLPCRVNALPVEKWPGHLEWWASQMIPLASSRRGRMRAILLRFAEAGIPVLIVTPPVNEFNRTYFARVSEAARSAVGPAADTAAVSFLTPSRLWPNEQFIDPTHMDPNQAESYRAWLAAAIVAALGD